MMKTKVLLQIIMIVVGLAVALPIPDNEDGGQELLAGKDTRYYAFPWFWFGRPLNDDDGDDYTGNGGQYLKPNSRRSSTISYADVGGGWGR